MPKSKEERYADVARVVAGLLLRAGPDAVRVSTVARLAGVSRPWLYKYLGGEPDDLIRYAVRDLMVVHPVMTDPQAPVVRALDREIERVFGRAPRHIASPGTYDQKHIARIGKLHDCVAYGPGILELAHQPDEWVGIDDMVASAKVMAAAALTLTGTWPEGEARF